MPLQFIGAISNDGLQRYQGWRWGDHGKIYLFPKGNERLSEVARKKAIRQARAIFWSGYKEH
jgi:hypothetical protein